MALNKLPRINEIIPVYAVIACLVYGWTILVFLWKLPAWIYFLTFTEILAIFSYSLATNVVESIMLLVLMLALSIILPRKLLLDVFVLQGTIVVTCLAGGVMLMLALYPFANKILFGRFPGWTILVIIVAGALLWLDRLSRGEFGHGTLLLYEPVIHIPLLISAPGQQERLDVYSPTSSVDVLPTLLSIAEQGTPAGVDGLLLPGFGGEEDFQRSIYSIEAKKNSAFKPLKTATISLIKEGQKLIYYAGYKKYSEVFELYDLEDDIEESKDLFSVGTLSAARMKEELLDTLETANRPFAKV